MAELECAVAVIVLKKGARRALSAVNEPSLLMTRKKISRKQLPGGRKYMGRYVFRQRL